MQNNILQYRKENISLPDDFAFNLFRVKGNPTPSPSLHIHDCLEINIVLHSGGKNIIEDTQHEMEQGDFYIINNLERHIAYPDETLEMIVIIFDPIFIWSGHPFDYEYLKPFFNKEIQFFNCIKKNESYNATLLEIVQEIELEWNNKNDGYRLIIKALLMKLLGVLYRHYTSENKLQDDLITRRKSYDRIKKVIEYIFYHFNEELSLEHLAKIALMNKTYFSTYFKQVMQMNVFDFILTQRINHAYKLLKNTNKSINDVSYESGFKSISHFNRVFKKSSDMTPMEYRKSQNK